jgi:nitroimidazol reductase NimA-like FMN-containing flavoprotein (pyridoxamine 5'-phosphate oxidase superfamily)
MTTANGSYPVSARSSASRHTDRLDYDRETVHAVLDAGFLGHLGYIVDGEPVVLPTLYVRVGERVYVHGSTGSRPLRMAGEGMPACFTVTLADGIVLARSAFNHSMNYRSVVVHGPAVRVTDADEQRAALDALLEHVIPGRGADCRPANARELSATALLRLELREVSAKVRSGDPEDDPEDMTLPHWAGVVPLAQVAGVALASGDLDPAASLPDYLAAFRIRT